MASTHVYKIMVRPNGETCPGISNSFCFRSLLDYHPPVYLFLVSSTALRRLLA